MAHEIAKLMLEQAGTFLERAEAIRVAMSLVPQITIDGT